MKRGIRGKFRTTYREIAKMAYVDGWEGRSATRIGHNVSVKQAVYDRNYARGRADRQQG